MMGFLNFFRKSKNIQLEENCLELTTSQLIARDILLNKATPLDKTGVIDNKITGIDSNCEKIVSAIHEELQAFAPLQLFQLLGQMQPPAPKEQNSAENETTAMDFLSNFGGGK